MKILNLSNNTILATDVVLADSVLARIKGLLGKKELSAGRALILRPCNSIHTFFIRFSIDVLFVDKDNKVIKAISSLCPYRLTPIYHKSAYVIELPVGTILSTNTNEGDTLTL